jgi:mannose/cellobiose epimerase-like protein (N-acyl-D-glucosamine 2-epimerase family)
MSGFDEARAAAARLQAWLLDVSLPLWWKRSAAADGYASQLGQGGRPTEAPRRLRVQARQAHVYALAASLGWRGPAEEASRRGLRAVLAARADDGLYRAGASATLDGMGLVYDQAFVLLALATCHATFGDPELESAAIRLMDRLAEFAHPLGGFAEAPGLPAPLFANPNMHAFEAFQAWSRTSTDPRWPELAAMEARLGLQRLIDGERGVLYEVYDADWRAPAGRLVWPGHLYEWALLLLDWAGADAASQAAALRLIEVAERTGVDPRRGVAMFALDGDLAPADRGARLWAQTERARACARAAAVTGDARLWAATAQACGAMEAFLQVPTPGLWRDWMDAAGAFREEPAPASSLYHIVGAIVELSRQTSIAA